MKTMNTMTLVRLAQQVQTKALTLEQVPETFREEVATQLQAWDRESAEWCATHGPICFCEFFKADRVQK
jgi:hypothetical protein